MVAEPGRELEELVHGRPFEPEADASRDRVRDDDAEPAPGRGAPHRKEPVAQVHDERARGAFRLAVADLDRARSAVVRDFFDLAPLAQPNDECLCGGLAGFRGVNPHTPFADAPQIERSRRRVRLWGAAEGYGWERVEALGAHGSATPSGVAPAVIVSSPPPGAPAAMSRAWSEAKTE